MYIKINEEKFNEFSDEIKSTCESKNYPFPSLIKNHDVREEYIFSDSEGEEFISFLDNFPWFKIHTLSFF